MQSFYQFITEAAVFPVKEDRFNKQLRTRRGFKVIMRLDAAKLWARYAQDNPTFTRLTPAKLDHIRELFDSGVVFDAYPLVTFFDGRVSIGDGRHRVFVAAEHHMSIEVGIDSERGATFPVELRS